uniref:NAD(P)H dehydrogenase (quinone) n=1 Tax=Brassica campestris TaxID=3711 RepID=M4E953_BRACM
MEAVTAIKPLIKVAAISGSLRKGSFNTGLLRAAMELTKESVPGMHIEHIDISPLPLINTDLESNGTYPPVVEAFRQKILEADSILFASPEYNFSVSEKIPLRKIDVGSFLQGMHPLILSVSFVNFYLVLEECNMTINFVQSVYLVDIPAPLKNAIDWASRSPNVWADKPAAIISTGGGFGGGRSQYHLRQIGVFLDLHFINKPEFTLNAFQPPQKFDAEGNLVDEVARERLKQVLVSLQAFTLRLQGK